MAGCGQNEVNAGEKEGKCAISLIHTEIYTESIR